MEGASPTRARTLIPIYVERVSSGAIATNRARVRIDERKLEAAKSTLLALAQMEGDYEDSSQLAAKLVLASGVSSEHFQRWWKNTDGKIDKIKVMFINGDIIARELASAPHSAAVCCVTEHFAIQNNFQNLLLAFPEHDLVDQNGNYVSSDVLIKVNDGLGGGREALSLATAVLEVGVSQTVRQLHDRLLFYASIPSIQMYVALKKYSGGGMIGMVFTRANLFNPTSIVSFGESELHHSVMRYLQAQHWMNVCIGQEFQNAPLCNAPNIPQYSLQFPAATLFIGRAGGVPAGALPMYSVDLFQVQRAFMTR